MHKTSLLSFLIFPIIILKTFQRKLEPPEKVHKTLETIINNYMPQNPPPFSVNPFYNIHFKNLKFIFTYSNYSINSLLHDDYLFDPITYSNLSITIQFETESYHFSRKLFQEKPTSSQSYFQTRTKGSCITLMFKEYTLFRGIDEGYHFVETIQPNDVKFNFNTVSQYDFFIEEILSDNNILKQLKDLFYEQIWKIELEKILCEYPQNKITYLFNKFNQQLLNMRPITISVSNEYVNCSDYHAFQFSRYYYEDLKRYTAAKGKIYIKKLHYVIDFNNKRNQYHQNVYFDGVIVRNEGIEHGKMYTNGLHECVELIVTEISRMVFDMVKKEENIT